MIRVASLPIRKDHHSRPLLADYTRHFQPVLPRVLDPAVGDIESLPPGDAQYSRRLGRFLRAVFGGASRSHFSLREIEDAGALAPLRHFQQRAATGLFDVVAVGGEGENVE